MKIASFSETAKFSDSVTELNRMIEDFATSLYKIALGIAKIASESRDLEDYDPTSQKYIASVSSRLLSVSSKYEEIKSTITLVNEEVDKINSLVKRKVLMKQSVFEASRNSVNRSSVFVEGEINDAKTLLAEGSPYKEAYYRMIEVTLKFVKLIKKFNKAVSAYNDLHTTNLTGARTDLSFFKLRLDVSNLPLASETPEDTDTSRGYKK